ncbi:MAG: tRNA (guanosine(37)-N1)-methyltransferase TrmD [Thermodesulfovibrio sp.]|uniref:tRNA (guanosine(37)-N1)-methyltransferase TrmD n=1 Tax=unclassified Thermodesulfovibrio TaxID=2645936 RepID=UPI00083B8DB5|nr:MULTISPECIES: tRNA (guanosine(37)-N1)-methyltransferase TrmD [unclassified Thermodesulfovibrio]MDI1471393.1 tRNA (guanosine(37)-N1)-methyltransferase TrmD [Thermodesulfovibrio sp. 1176]MDI6714580.1 tRNA (guanosine(37)-N1)-methyltransferase TrmD [Thermodesulfovibrio sp.]ODA43829.1 tRNA (Guanine37-N1) -methyltransferase [Thermodesulfovibrio sp. N1]
MKKFDVLTIFPELIECYLKYGVLGKALKKGLAEVKIYNLRDYTSDKHRKVDDYAYGGGAGMVMQIEPFYNAIKHLKSNSNPKKFILLSPQGRRFNQKVAQDFYENQKELVLICGRYEGIDERVKLFIDDEISIGDYVLSGGELAALVIIESVVRLIPEALGDELSAKEDSFMKGFLDYPQYTRPEEFEGMKVPEVLLSGNHKKIELWRKTEAIRKTLIQRPDLLKNLSNDELRILKELCSEINRKILEGENEPVNH